MQLDPVSPLYTHLRTSNAQRAALSACGWLGKFGLRDILSEYEAHGHFERSAALAVWHGDLGSAVSALQMGADAIRHKLTEEKTEGDTELHDPLIHGPLHALDGQYAETLQLVAMCVAGYSGNGAESTSSASGVWHSCVEGLLQRPDMTKPEGEWKGHVAYLRSVCIFLLNIGRVDGLEKTLYDENLSLSDRVAFACRFLSRRDLKSYINECVKRCQDTGNLEGILITGMNRQGIALIQSYVDTYSDVQTAALLSSRVILPAEWVTERVICSEWLDSYRGLLNTWQMWQSRSTFDVGRAEMLRRIKGRQHADELAINTGSSRGPSQYQGRRAPFTHNYSQGRRQPAPTSATKQTESELSMTHVPAQLYARCNYCNTSLPLSRLRRQEGMANTWLSRQKPVLSCCPQCKKPLPRCAICLLPLGCLNPYMELKRERNKMSRGNGQQDMGDLSELSNLPFAEVSGPDTSCEPSLFDFFKSSFPFWVNSRLGIPSFNFLRKCEFYLDSIFLLSFQQLYLF